VISRPSDAAGAGRQRAPAALAGLVAALIHLGLCLYVHYQPAEGSWQWFPVFIVDFPGSLAALLLTRAAVPPFVAFALCRVSLVVCPGLFRGPRSTGRATQGARCLTRAWSGRDR
jgi:hypothetical protein